MSDLFYDLVVFAGRHPFWLSSRPVVRNAEVTDRPGPYLLAATHTSPYDVPLLMRHTRRRVDFVSIVEVFRNPVVGWFYGSMNAFPIDRSRPDAPTVRILLDRLAHGRVVGIFPEGRVRMGQDSVVHTHRIRPGIGRLACLAQVPIIPVVIVNSAIYTACKSWLPLRHTRYAIAYGHPILPDVQPETVEDQLVRSFVQLHASVVEETGMAIA